MKKGICKLCDLEKELKRSHVIGRAVFKKALKGANHALRFDRQHNKVVKDQDQWATYMLCGECEQKLNKKYEEYSLNVLRDRMKSVKHKKRDSHYEIQGVDQKKLILYLLSIMWRGIESNHEVFKKLKIFDESPVAKNFLKKSVKNEQVFLTECFDLRISKLVSLIAPFSEMELDFITDIYCNIDEKQRIRLLTIFEGYCFEFFFLTDKSQFLTGLGVLKKNKSILKMPYIDIFSIPEFQKSLLVMIESQKQH
ncbi:hypothetical protein [Acinetobacter baumannii]|uniref:hypothetical protein n=1 Tax=Acinetobacter baumannii TaxID=470 RepID=UPI0021B13E12|nr:hypothetical protein [Acinetobacter baumannii]MCT6584792.1 hypothetical protein [Acinetobacter baumannii]MCT6587869.1 hypothetical protein [Acinetobacter baumannii]MCT6596492.1 hypothetical protein [Acinetobacter baumannii]MCT6656329.1 hypothetical protein [Acinetobacter baumannii]MCT6659601.1 hypothetical protein [Acinetobacter baumannii]